MATAAEWLEGARLRTLPAAVAPVLVGTGAAAQQGSAHLGRAALAAGVALALQVGVNYANDYSDGVRGTDVERVGPMRLTASGAARPEPRAHRGVGGVRGRRRAGAVAVAVERPVVAGRGRRRWRSSRPGPTRAGATRTATEGLGEVGVFVFFGLVAVLGTTWTQAGRVPGWPAWAGAVGIGLLACALLMVNNIRDIPTDALSGKRTLAVRLGEAALPAAVRWPSCGSPSRWGPRARWWRRGHCSCCCSPCRSRC